MIVAFTVHNRPHYLRETLESWREARGVEAVSALFSCEPGSPESVELCRKADFFSGRPAVLEHQQPQGVLANPKRALDEAFGDEAEFAVLAEEDVVVSTDVLELLNWSACEFEGYPKVLLATANQVDPKGGLSTVLTVPYFQGWVWGTWADRWPGLSADWDTTYLHRGWDHRINDHWTGELGYLVAAPAVARCQHIGREGGTHCTPAMADSLAAREFHRHVPPQVYRLMQ